MSFFKTFEFEFETRRLMWYIPAGGSDFAEVQKTTEKIKEGNYESWYENWLNLANQLIQKSYKSAISQGMIYLRASRYFQASEFFLHPKDSRKLDVYNKSVSYFYKGLDLLKVNYQINILNYKGIKLRTVFFPCQENCKGTIFVCGGFDALLEELYFTNAKSALQEGYNVVLFEGPGQSHAIRQYAATFTPDWDKVCEAVLSYYKGICASPNIGIGLSLGGLLIARAQSQNPNLFDKIVLYNYFPELSESFKTNIPKLLHHFSDTQFPAILEKIVSLYISCNKFLNWQIEHAKWVFGATSLNQLLHICRDYKELPLKSPCLVCLASNDNYYNYELGIKYFNNILSQDKKLIIFNKDNYASDMHCQNGSAYDTNDEIFEWLDK